MCYTASADASQLLRLIRYSYFGTFATLPGHEGDEHELSFGKRAKSQ
jgi:hypothetical protein